MKANSNQKKGFQTRLFSGLTTLLLLVVVVLCLFFTLQNLTSGYVSVGGFSAFRVVTGSMEPEIPVNALLLSKKVPIEEIKKDDIVCFRVRTGPLRGAIITHRVVGVYCSPGGEILLQTKGDANLAADAENVTNENFIGSVVWHTGEETKMAKLVDFLTSDFGFLACIVLPVIFIAIWIFKDAVQSVKKAILESERELSQIRDEKSSTGAQISEEEYQSIYTRIKSEMRKEKEQNEEDTVSVKALDSRDEARISSSETFSETEPNP